MGVCKNVDQYRLKKAKLSYSNPKSMKPLKSDIRKTNKIKKKLGLFKYK